MRFFPMLKDGDRINRKWLNSLISFVNSLYVIGDGNTTTVSHYENSTVVHAKGGVAQQGGGGGAKDDRFSVSVGERIITVNGGRIQYNNYSNGQVQVLDIPSTTFYADESAGSLFLVFLVVSSGEYRFALFPTNTRTGVFHGAIFTPLAKVRKTETTLVLEESYSVADSFFIPKYTHSRINANFASGTYLSGINGSLIDMVYLERKYFMMTNSLSSWTPSTGTLEPQLSYGEGEAITYGFKFSTVSIVKTDYDLPLEFTDQYQICGSRYN